MEFQTTTKAIDVNLDRCLAEDVVFKDEYNPHSVRPWIIGNEYGALCLVWASSEQDALDNACDANLLAGIALDEEVVEELVADGNEDSIMYLGNASEPFESENVWLTDSITLTHKQERMFAEARGAGAKTLDNI